MLGAVLLGCGDDSGDEPGAPDGGMDGGMMPMTQSPGSNNNATTPTPTGPPPLVCGDFTCRGPGQDIVDLLAGSGLPIGGGIFPAPCCTEDDACGLQLISDAGSSCVPAPPPDARCPNVDFFGTSVAGCCVEELGICGVDTVQYGGGCVEYAGGLGAIFGMEPLSCGDDDGGVADGGGAEDAGH